MGGGRRVPSGDASSPGAVSVCVCCARLGFGVKLVGFSIGGKLVGADAVFRVVIVAAANTMP